MSENPNLLDKASIEAEYRRYRTSEDLIHNKDLHRRILAAWEQESPIMWANLQAQGLTQKLAFVVQERMWRRQDELMQAGFPVTDAREMAEREELMMEPETAQPDNSDLPIALQEAPPNLQERYRTQMETSR